MARLRVEIDPSGAEDGARKLRAILDQISNETSRLVKSYVGLGDSVKTAMLKAGEAVDTWGSLAKGEYALAQAASAKYIGQLQYEAEALRKLTAEYTKAEAAKRTLFAPALQSDLRFPTQGPISPNNYGVSGSQSRALHSIFGESGGVTPRRFQELSAGADAASKNFDKLSRSSLNMATQLGLGLTAVYAIRRAMVEGVEAFAGYEKQISIIQAVTGATAEELSRLKEAARESGRTSLFNAEDSARALAELTKAGFSANEAIAALSGTINFAVNAQIDLATAADYTAKILRQYGLDSSLASKVTDSLTVVAFKTTTTVENLANAFKYVGPSAHSLNISLEETAAAMGVLAQRGIDASLSGTTLRGMLFELAAPTRQAREQLATLGLTAEDVNPRLSSFTEVLHKLKDAQLTFGDAVQIFDKRVAGGALVLSQYVDELEALRLEQEKGIDASKKAADIIGNNLSGSWQKFKNSLTDTSITIGESNNWLQKMVDDATNVNNKLGEMVRFNNMVADSQKRLIEGARKYGSMQAYIDHNAAAASEAKQLYTEKIEKAFSERVAKPISIPVQLDFSSLQESGSDSTAGIQAAIKSATGYYDELTDAIDDGNSALVALARRRSLETELATLQKKAIKDLDKEYQNLATHIYGAAGDPDAAKQAIGELDKKFEGLKKSIMDTGINLDEFQEKVAVYTREKSEKAALDAAAKSFGELLARREEYLDTLTKENDILARGGEGQKAAIRNAKDQTKAWADLEAIYVKLKAASGGKKANDAADAAMDKAAAELEKVNAGIAKNIELNEKFKQDQKDSERMWHAYVRMLVAANDILRDTATQYKMVDALKAELEALGQTNEERERTIRLREFDNAAVNRDIQDLAKMRDEYDKLLQKLENKKRVENLANGIADSMSMAAENILIDTKNISDYIEDMIRDIQRQLLNDLFTRPLKNALFSLFSDLFSGMGLFGGGKSWTGGSGIGPPSSGYGNVFNNGNVEHFAQGGIINQLTRFPMGRGSAIAGDKGMESIMPLGRDNQGRLGVQIVGGSQGYSGGESNETTTIHKTTNINVTTPDADSFRRSRKQILRDTKRNM